ncbi:hypothetical protein [Endozoicomonas sp.]|uniref:hypothetical protein n=1 Tax=Endozoicomonas sp. TaxID=1892382 RepID=UPI002887407F|nr:hypothetical protein [Endozoicomonas sp.]
MAHGNTAVSSNNIAASRLAMHSTPSPSPGRKNPYRDSHPASMGIRTVSKPEITEPSFLGRLAERIGLTSSTITEDQKSLTDRAYGNNGYTGRNCINTINLKTTKGDIILAVSDAGGIFVEPAPDTNDNPRHRATFEVNTTRDIKARLPKNIEEVDISTDSGSLIGVISATGDYTVCNGSINVEIRSAIPVLAKTDKGSLTATGYNCRTPSESSVATETPGYREFVPTTKLPETNRYSKNPGRIKLTVNTAGDITFKYQPFIPTRPK